MSAPRILLSLTLALGACGTSTSRDAGSGMDGGRDNGRQDIRDTGPLCDPGCAPAERCCGAEDGPTCTPILNDVENCGACGFDCVAENRGASCEQGDCVCGRATLGCLGTRQSFCCPPLAPGGEPYCADLDRDISDCGGCGEPCPALRTSRCTGGTCICGDLRGPCPVGETCCDVGAGAIECRDTTSDDDHCGACNEGCLQAERCEGSTCTRGEEACADGCEGGTICCNGECCARSQCGDSGCA